MTGPTYPSQPPPRGRGGWVLPTVAAAVAVLLAGATGAYLLYGRTSNGGKGTGASAKPSSPPPSAAVQGPDVCAMLPKETVDRLVPLARVAATSRDSEYTVDFDCDWANNRISYGDYWRSREIDVKVRQHKGEGAKTGRSMAQNSFEVDYGGAKYAETARPTPKEGERDYTSAVKDLPGVGESAFAQYTWRRVGTTLWYSYGTARARVGDMTIEVKYQASQQRKDARMLTSETTQSVTEANAIREVTGLAAQIAKEVAAWKARHPGVLARPRQAVTSAPSVQPTPSPGQLTALPPACEAVDRVAAGLVPGPTTRARSTEAGGDAQFECRWLNRDIDAGGGVTRVRSALITTHSFTDRAGSRDAGAARSFYTSERGGDRNFEDSSMGGVTWGRVADVKGLGEAAYTQYTGYRRGEVFNGAVTVLVRRGATVVQVDYAGAERPAGEPADSAKVRLMAEKEARDGALTLARAYLAALAKGPGGS